MPSIEARVLALEGGPRRAGGCLWCEVAALNRAVKAGAALQPTHEWPECPHPAAAARYGIADALTGLKDRPARLDPSPGPSVG